MSANLQNQQLKRQKRFLSETIIVNNTSYSLRDQQPISQVALSKCLTDNWQVADFIEHLNNRVFMWPTKNRLERHFNRYINEHPVIFKFNTHEILDLNSHVKFCRLNSGATRANSYLDGIAPMRGANTFLTAANYNLPISSVAEVTFEIECNLDCDIFIGNHPNADFTLVA